MTNLVAQRFRNPVERTAKPKTKPARARSFSVKRSSISPINPRKPTTSSEGLCQFSVKNTYSVTTWIPYSAHASKIGRTFSVAARCPSVRGSPRCSATCRSRPSESRGAAESVDVYHYFVDSQQQSNRIRRPFQKALLTRLCTETGQPLHLLPRPIAPPNRPRTAMLPNFGKRCHP